MNQWCWEVKARSKSTTRRFSMDFTKGTWEFVQSFGKLGVIERNEQLGIFKTFEPMKLPIVSTSLDMVRDLVESK